MIDRDTSWMERALALAELATAAGEVPVGAVVVDRETLLAEAHNRTVTASDPTAHAEIEALRIAARSANAPRLPGATLYVTLEPCLMCLGAIVQARIARLVFAASDPKLGATAYWQTLPLGPAGLNHRVELRGGVLADRAAELLRSFFRERR
jgi:tRNA(adenine34) deaminase